MRRTFLALAALAALALLAFGLWPEIDLELARRFHGDAGFIGGSALAKAARRFFNVTPFVVLAGMALLYALRRFGFRTPYAPSGRAVVFLVLTMALGPGLIVNLGLKDHSHRPRPINTQDFGGPQEFRPWYRFDGGCAKNCSFVSGEAAEAFWMVAPASLAPPPWRPLAIGAALAFGVAGSALRMAFGAHYLSDVTLAGLIATMVVVGVGMAMAGRGGGKAWI